MGGLSLDERGGALRVVAQVPVETPAYNAGLELGDELRELDGQSIRTDSDVSGVLSRRRPGDTIQAVFIDRSGQPKTANLTLDEDPALELVPIEFTGGSLMTAQEEFRTRWLH